MEDTPRKPNTSPYDWASDPESGVLPKPETRHQPIGVWRSGEGTGREADIPVLEILEHGVHEGQEFLRVLLDGPAGTQESTIPAGQFMEGNPDELVTTEREEPPVEAAPPPSPEETPVQPEPRVEPAAEPAPRRIEVTHASEEEEESEPSSGILASLGESLSKAESQQSNLENELASVVEQINQAVGQKDFRKVSHLAEQAQDYKSRIRRKEKYIGKLKKREALAQDLLNNEKISGLANQISEAVSAERTRRIRLQDREPIDSYEDMISRLHVGDYLSKSGVRDPKLYDSLKTEITSLVKSAGEKRASYSVQDNRVVKDEDLRDIDKELAAERQQQEARGWSPVREKDAGGEATLKPGQLVQVVYDGKVEPYWDVRSLVRNSSGDIMAQVYPPYNKSEGRAPFWILESQLLDWQTRQPELQPDEAAETAAEPETAEPAEAGAAAAEPAGPGAVESPPKRPDRSLLRPLPEDMPGLISRGEPPPPRHRGVRDWLHLGHRGEQHSSHEGRTGHPAEISTEGLEIGRGDKLIHSASGATFTVKRIHPLDSGIDGEHLMVELASPGAEDKTARYDDIISAISTPGGPWRRAEGESPVPSAS